VRKTPRLSKKKFRHTGTVSRLTVMVDHEVPALKKMLTWLRPGSSQQDTLQTYATYSQNGPWNLDNWLRYYGITILRLVAAFYWNTV